MMNKNVAMLMDKYELTMANAYYKTNKLNDIAVFDIFFRKIPDNGGFAILSGIDQVIDYIRNFHFTDEDINYLKLLKEFDEGFLEYIKENSNKFYIKVIGLPEGSIIYPNTPILTIEAPLVFAQLLETYILTIINHNCLIATKANRFVRAANGRAISDFGARRAQGGDAALYGARAAYIGGVNSTATVLSGKLFNIPISGTMAHSWVMSFNSELEAFKTFADIYPKNCILLIDTYDVLKSGIKNAIETFNYIEEKYGELKNYGIRIDSGDLAYLSKEVRKELDKANHQDAKIIVSNSLTEEIIYSLINEQGAPIDAFGVGENLITAKSDAVFGAVYKLVELNGTPKIKISNNIEKVTNPGKKYLYRLYNKESGYAIGDMISQLIISDDSLQNYKFINTDNPLKEVIFDSNIIKVKKLNSLLYYREKSEEIDNYLEHKKELEDIRYYVNKQLTNEIYPEEKRFNNPHKHPLYMESNYYKMKMDLLKD